MSPGGGLPLRSHVPPGHAGLVVRAYLAALDLNLGILSIHCTLLALKVYEGGEAGVREPLRKDLHSFYFTEPRGET